MQFLTLTSSLQISLIKKKVKNNSFHTLLLLREDLKKEMNDENGDRTPEH